MRYTFSSKFSRMGSYYARHLLRLFRRAYERVEFTFLQIREGLDRLRASLEGERVLAVGACLAESSCLTTKTL